MEPEIESLICRLLVRNPAGTTTHRGSLLNLAHDLSDQIIGNVLRRLRIAPAPKRNQTTAWKYLTTARIAAVSGWPSLRQSSGRLARSDRVLCSVLLPAKDTTRNVGRHNPHAKQEACNRLPAIWPTLIPVHFGEAIRRGIAARTEYIAYLPQRAGRPAERGPPRRTFGIASLIPSLCMESDQPTSTQPAPHAQSTERITVDM